VPKECEHNAHMYYILLDSLKQRKQKLRKLEEKRVKAVIHYVPLHSSPAGKKYGRLSGKLPITEDISGRILRLPLFMGLTARQQFTISELLG